jgi:carboxyl-terminal processing protease
MRNRVLPLLAIAVIALATLAGGYYGSARPAHVTDADSELTDQLGDEFKKALSEIQENYAGKVDLELFGKNAILGMLHQLDPHSAFFTKAEFDEVQTEQSSRIYGIGVTIAKRYDHVYILSATPGAPGHATEMPSSPSISKTSTTGPASRSCTEFAAKWVNRLR